jgi:hypothetical protein
MGGSIESKETQLKSSPVSSPNPIQTVNLPSLGTFTVVNCQLHGLATTAFEKTTQFDSEQQSVLQRYLIESDPAFKDNFLKVYDFHLNDSRVEASKLGQLKGNPICQSLLREN